LLDKLGLNIVWISPAPGYLRRKYRLRKPIKHTKAIIEDRRILRSSSLWIFLRTIIKNIKGQIKETISILMLTIGLIEKREATKAMTIRTKRIFNAGEVI
jgi:hypothetical protein